MRVLNGSLAALLGVMSALAVGCGNRDNLLSGSDADRLKGTLADLREDVQARSCAGVRQRIDELKGDLASIGGSVDVKLRRRLTEEITQKLVPQAGTECAAPRGTTSTPSTTTTTPSTTETTPTTDSTSTETTTSTPSTSTTAPTTPTTPTTTPTTPTTPTVPPTDTGDSGGFGDGGDGT